MAFTKWNASNRSPRVVAKAHNRRTMLLLGASTSEVGLSTSDAKEDTVDAKAVAAVLDGSTAYVERNIRR